MAKPKHQATTEDGLRWDNSNASYFSPGRLRPVLLRCPALRSSNAKVGEGIWRWVGVACVGTGTVSAHGFTNCPARFGSAYSWSVHTCKC